MGKNNRARRAAARASHDENTELADELLDFAASPGREHEFGRAQAAAHLCLLNAGAVNREAQRHLLVHVARAWRMGWQPREAIRQIRRATDAPIVELALVAVAAEHAHYNASTIDPRWAAQLTELELPAVVANQWLTDWLQRTAPERPEQIRVVVGLLRSLSLLTPIPILIPPPGTHPVDDTFIDLTSKANDPMLDRVRALLAQAESTTFEAEAETFTAKAQELMTRHAIDMAMLSAGARRAERPDTIRIPIDDPYVAAKSLLLQFVAESSRCQAVFHDRHAMSSVVGFATDLAATETLFTSLLVQAQIALQSTAKAAPPGTRARSRGFRSAFLMAYAHRVAERLAEINSYVVAHAEAETGRSILPVLAQRSSVVDGAVSEMFGRLRESPVRGGFDAAGWASGRLAADRARFGSGGLDDAFATSSDPQRIAARNR